MLRKFFDWLNLADLDEARKKASVQIASRYARGNILIQNGHSMNAADLARLSAKADVAMGRLRHALHLQ